MPSTSTTLSSPAPSSSGGGDKEIVRLEPAGCQWELQAYDGSGTGPYTSAQILHLFLQGKLSLESK
eukprot:scaffold148747_cov17-Tisochrysis_lutea.AAC.1